MVCKITKQTSSNSATHEELTLENVSRSSAALAAGLKFGFSPLIWQYNTSAEVFALHNMFISLIAYILVIYSNNIDSTSTICLGSFMCGLSLTNQHTSILFIIPVVVYVSCTSSMWVKPRLFMMSAASFVAGISFYALLPLMAIRRPQAGSWGDVTTVAGFIHHFLRRDYGTMRLYSGDDTATEGMNEIIYSWGLDFLSRQLSRSSLIILSVLGIISGLVEFLWKEPENKPKRTKGVKNPSHAKVKPPRVWRVILFTLTFYLVVFHTLANLPLSNPLLFGIHQRFWMHPNILMYILIGVWLYKIITSTPNKLTQLIAIGVVLVKPCTTYWQNRSVSDQAPTDSSESTHYRF